MLRFQALRGFTWLGGATLVTAALAAVQLLFVARLLSPSEVAALALATVCLAFFLMLFDLGLSQSAIYAGDLPPGERAGRLWTTAALGLAAALTIYLLRGPIGALLNSPALVQYLPVVAAIAGVFLPIQVMRSEMERTLAFKRVAVAETAGTLSGTVITLVLLIARVGPMAVLAGLAVSYAVQAALILRLARPRWGFVRPTFAFLQPGLQFGWPLTVQRSLNFILSNIDFIFVGMLTSAASLGQYVMAFNLGNLLAARISPVMSRVLFPLLTRMKDDHQRANRAICAMIDAVATLVGPVLMGLGALGPVLVPYLLGEKWRVAGELLQILAFVGYLRAVNSIAGPCLAAFGRSRTGMAWSFVATLLQAVSMYFGVRMAGAYGAAVSFAVIQVVFIPLGWRLIYRRLSAMPFRPFVLAHAPGMATSLAVFLSANSALRIATPIWGSLAGLAVATATGVLCFGVLIGLFRRRWLADLLTTRKDFVLA